MSLSQRLKKRRTNKKNSTKTNSQERIRGDFGDSGGVILNPPESPEKPNVVLLVTSQKRVSPGKMWCFTLNNYKDDELVTLVTLFNSHSYVIGKEVGEEGTPHLQGYVKFTRKVRPMSVVENKRIHWEKCKGSEKDNIEYCTKDGDFVTNIKGVPRPLKLYRYDEFREFQKRVWDMCVQPCMDDRSIYWFWDEAGNLGKTQVCKTLAHDEKAMIVNGGAKDIFSRIVLQYIKFGFIPEIVIWNLTRSVGQGEDKLVVSYAAMESVKDGLIASGKFEGGQLVFNSPHVVVMANYPPDYAMLSSDRWKVEEISEGASATLTW